MPIKNPFNSCFEFSDNRKNATFKDKKARSTYVYPNVFQNPISGHRVDACILSSQNVGDKKCDFLLLNHDDSKAWAVLIELKGSDLMQAVRQISKTMDELSAKLSDYTIHARIVLTRTYAPAIQSSEYINLKKRIEKKGGKLSQSSSAAQMIETILK